MATQQTTEGFVQAITSCELIHFPRHLIANCGSRMPAHDVRIFQKYKDWCTFYSHLIQQWWFALAARWQTVCFPLTIGGSCAGSECRRKGLLRHGQRCTLAGPFRG